MADHVAGRKLPLRHPAENPMFIFMVILNLIILGVLIEFLATASLIPHSLPANVGVVTGDLTVPESLDRHCAA